MTRQSSFVSAQNDILLFRCTGRSALCFLLPFIKALHDLIIGLTADGRQFSAQFHTGSLEAHGYTVLCAVEGTPPGTGTDYGKTYLLYRLEEGAADADVH